MIEHNRSHEPHPWRLYWRLITPVLDSGWRQGTGTFPLMVVRRNQSYLCHTSPLSLQQRVRCNWMQTAVHFVSQGMDWEIRAAKLDWVTGDGWGFGVGCINYSISRLILGYYITNISFGINFAFLRILNISILNYELK